VTSYACPSHGFAHDCARVYISPLGFVIVIVVCAGVVVVVATAIVVLGVYGVWVETDVWVGNDGAVTCSENALAACC